MHIGEQSWMKKQIILAGIAFLVLGALFLIIYQIPETKEKSKLVLSTHEFQFLRFVQTTKVNVSLENSSEYRLKFSFPTTFYENHSFQLMDPQGSDVPPLLESAKAELHVVTIRGGLSSFL
jgi:hypothetical protein